MDKKGLGFLLLAVLLVASALVFLPAVSDTTKAQAQTNPINVSGRITGWMWSTGVGWIKLSNSSALPVRIDGNSLNGYGWSDNIGWINFAPIGPYPIYGTYPRHSVKIKTEGETGPDYPVIGYARACSVYASGCSGALKSSAELGGWDGWIRMENSFYNTDNFIFSGQAWGNLNLAWVGFYSGTPPPPPPDCIPDLNCTCDDPEPPDGCPPSCVGPDCGGGGGDNFTVNCVADKESIDIDEDVTFTATAVPSGSYTYLYSGQTGSNTTLTVNPFTTSYPLVGTISNLNVAVTNEAEETITANCQTATGGHVIVEEDDEDECTFSVTNNFPLPILFQSRTNMTYSIVNANRPFTINVEGCSDPLDLTFTPDPEQPIDFQCLLDGVNWGACSNLSDGEYKLRAGAVYDHLNLDALDGGYSFFNIGAPGNDMVSGYVRIDTTNLD